MTLVFIFVLVSSAVVGIIMLLFKAVLNFAGRELSAESKETVLMVLLSFQPISAAIMLVAESIPLQPYPTVGHEVLAFVTASAAEVSAETIKSGSAGTGSTFIYILVFVWCVTAAVILIKKAVGYAVFRNAVEKTGLRKQEGCPTIMVSDAVTSPFLMGVFRPVIVIPVSDLCRDELEMAVSHEKAHYQRHDTAKKAFAELLKSLNWFNPLFYMLTDELYELSELIADSITVLGRSHDERKAYGMMLLKFIDRQRKSELCVHMSGNAKKLKRRLEFIMMPETKKVNTFMVAVHKAAGIAFGAAILFFMYISVHTVVCVVDDNSITYGKDQLPINGYSMINDIGEKISPDSFECNEMSVPQNDMYSVSMLQSDRGYSVDRVSYGNGQTIVLCSDDEAGFDFSKNSKAVICILPDLSPDYSNIDGSGELVKIGYIYNGIATELYKGRINTEGLEVEFSAEENGKYMFYVVNSCAGLQNIENLKIIIL